MNLSRLNATVVLLVTVIVIASCSSATPDPTPTTPHTSGSPSDITTPPATSVPGATPTPISPTQAAATSTPTQVPRPPGNQAGSGTGSDIVGIIPIPPDRDLYDLGRRLTLRSDQPVNRFASPPPGPLREGDRIEWLVSRAEGNVRVDAEVKLVSENAYWIFEDGADPDPGRLSQAANRFENDVWPNVTGLLGDVWNPGVDADPRIVIFHGQLRPGVAGYFSGTDQYPIAIQPDSNQRETIYISSNLLTLGGNSYIGTLAHELQHAIHWAADVGEESWLNEGLAELASGFAGVPPGSISSFLARPNTSLVQWEPEIFQASPNYGASALFFEYISAHYGGVETLRAVVDHPVDGLESIDAVMAEIGAAHTANEIFANWVVANFVDDDSGPFSHPDRTLNRPRSETIDAPDTITDTVRPFGTNYYVIEDVGDTLTVQFRGVPTGQVFPAEPHSGETCWWANAGDSINTTLTRSVDLREVESATFNYSVWYAIEKDWDYAYIDVSTDGGTTWEILASDLSSFGNPNGTAFGPGLTGLSDDWLQDSVNLSRFAGSEILLRIEYITDDAIHDRGACLDDFSIPEIGWSDDAESQGDWETGGFALIDGRQPVEYAVQVVRDTGDSEATVERVSVDANGMGEITVQGPADGEQVIVAVSVLTRDITGSLSYSIGFNAE